MISSSARSTPISFEVRAGERVRRNGSRSGVTVVSAPRWIFTELIRPVTWQIEVRTSARVSFTTRRSWPVTSRKIRVVPGRNRVSSLLMIGGMEST